MLTVRNITREADEKFAEAARNFLKKEDVRTDGYGYIHVPTSSRLRAEIDKKYFTLFALPADKVKGNRPMAFIVAKNFKGDKIEMGKPHIKLAIGEGGEGIRRLAGKFRRKIKFIS